MTWCEAIIVCNIKQDKDCVQQLIIMEKLYDCEKLWAAIELKADITMMCEGVDCELMCATLN